MTIKASTYGKGRNALHNALRERQPFVTGGALKATNPTHVSSWDSGRLAGVDLDKFRQDMADIVYVVWSYSTPIAWVRKDGSAYRVTQRFSATTSKHQGMLYPL